MKSFHLLTPVVGGLACGAKCPFCVAHMTPTNGLTMKAIKPDPVQLAYACKYARAHGANNLLLTSKGEATNWPDLITDHLRIIQTFGFAAVELQTNGIHIAQRKPVSNEHIKLWNSLGLNLIAISITHFDAEMNRQTYMGAQGRPYIDLPQLVADLHNFGYKVRLACIMHTGQIDSSIQVAKLMDFARSHQVEQLTIRPVNKTEDSGDEKTAQWVTAHQLTATQKQEVQEYLDSIGQVKEIFSWGGRVYDVNGQNVCYTNSLTKESATASQGRQLIFFPPGLLSDGWESKAVPLSQLDPAWVAAQS